MSAHSQLVDDEYSIEPAPIQPVELKNHDGHEAKQVAIYDQDGNVMYGSRDVTGYLFTCQDPQSSFRTLQFVKMAAIPKFRHSEEVRHVREVLHGEEDTGYLRDFLEDHFVSILSDIRAFHKRQCPSFDPMERAAYATHIDSLPIELQLPVPVMMDDDGRADFRIAAVSAGAAEVELREEPLCAAATYMPALARAGCVKIGQCVLIIDVGGMTADFATTKLLQPPSSDGSGLRMQRIGQCHGNAAGSNFLNAQVQQSLLEEPDLQECLLRLEIDRHNLLQQLSDWFDGVKREIDTPGKHEFSFLAQSSHGQSGVEGLSHHEVFQFSRNKILQFYSNWIEYVKQELKKHLSTKVGETFAGVIMVGGGTRSAMLKENLAEFLATYGIHVLTKVVCELPCSQGGLTQHCFERDTLPSPCFWYISRTEPYCETTHPDAKLHENLQLPSEFDPTVTVVHDRLIKIKQFSEQEGFLPKKNRRLLLEVRVLMHDDPSKRRQGRLHIPLLWSEIPRNEHSPVYTHQGQRLHGLRDYSVMFDLPKPDVFKQKRFKKHKPKGQQPYYLLHVFVDMQGDASSLVMNATIMKANFARKSKGLQFRYDLAWFSPHSHTIWTPNSSHFVSQYTGTSDIHTRFNTQDESAAKTADEPAGEAALAVDALNHSSRSIDFPDDSPDQAPEGPRSPYEHSRSNNNTGAAMQHLRKRTRENSERQTKRKRNTLQHQETTPTASGSNTRMIARQLQTLEREMEKLQKERALMTLPLASRTPGPVESPSATRTSTVFHSSSPELSSERDDLTAYTGTDMLLREFE